MLKSPSLHSEQSSQQSHNPNSRRKIQGGRGESQRFNSVDNNQGMNSERQHSASGPSLKLSLGPFIEVNTPPAINDNAVWESWISDLPGHFERIYGPQGILGLCEDRLDQDLRMRVRPEARQQRVQEIDVVAR